MNNIDLKQNHYYKIKLKDDSPTFFGMFYKYEPNTSNLLFIYNIHEQLAIETIIVPSDCSIDYITHEEWKMIMCQLISNGYYFEESKGINLIYKPLPGEIVFFYNIESGESGYGAYIMSPDDKVCMYAYQSANGVFFKDLTYEVGNTSNTYIKKTSKEQKDNFNTLLFAYGKQWSNTSKRIIPNVLYRSRKNEPYCYINDRFTITYKTDEWTATDNNRFNAGNYFRSEGEAQEVLQLFNEILIKRQANKNIEQDQTKILIQPPLPHTNKLGKSLRRKRGRPRKEK